MDNNKSTRSGRNGSLLQLGILLNLSITLISVGFLAYKVHVLEQKVVHLESVSPFDHPRHVTEEDLTAPSRRRRSVAACQECREECVKLLGVDSSQKVILYSTD